MSVHPFSPIYSICIMHSLNSFKFLPKIILVIYHIGNIGYIFCKILTPRSWGGGFEEPPSSYFDA